MPGGSRPRELLHIRAARVHRGAWGRGRRFTGRLGLGHGLLVPGERLLVLRGGGRGIVLLHLLRLLLEDSPQLGFEAVHQQSAAMIQGVSILGFNLGGQCLGLLLLTLAPIN